MKNIKKFIFLFVLLAAVFTPGHSAEAAKLPGKVTGLTAEVKSETSVKLSWKKVSGANSYVIYKVNPSTGKKTAKLATTSKTSYTVNKLKANTGYAFVVYSKNSAGTCKKASDIVKVTTSLSAPNKVSGLKVSSYGNKSVTLKWNSVKNAGGYAVYQYDPDSKQYKQLGTTKDASYTVSGLKVGSSYKFMVRSYRKVNGKTKYAADSNTVTAYPVNNENICGRKYSATLKVNLNVKINTSGQKVSLKKGQKVYANKPSATKKEVTAQLPDGRRFKVNAGNLRFTNTLYTSSRTYSKSTAENFVNSKGYSSPTSYLIWISQYNASVTIFKGSKGKWKQVRSCVCVIGKSGKTPTGTYKICRRDSAYGGPRVYFTWNPRKGEGNSFHRYISSTHHGAESHGCVRMANADLDYLAKNCAMGTTVISY